MTNAFKFFIIGCIVVLDQFFKILVMLHLDPYGSLEIVKDVFYIRVVKNSGLAFGFGSNWLDFDQRKLLFILMMALAIFILIRFFYKVPKENFLENLGFSFILGGALSNLSDKLIGDLLYYQQFKFLYGQVIDYISFQSGNYLFPTFNLADLAISLGLIILLLFSKADEKVNVRSKKN